MNPSFSVIIPTYNWSSVLRYSISSVLRQTITDFELFVVGDGCTDDSEDVVRHFGDARVRWINLPVNTGHQSEPNNEGLRHAQGQYIAYLNHDDLWLPHHLESLRSVLKGGADFAYGLCLLVMPDGERRLEPDPTHENYFPGMWIPPTNVVHRRGVIDKVGGWRKYREIDNYPDADLWMRVHAADFRFAFLPRLSAIKFPAVARRDVYKTRPCHEQAAWSQRIESEGDLESSELIKIISAKSREAAAAQPGAKLYRVLSREFFRETRQRVIRRLRSSSVQPKAMQRGAVDAARAFKGLDPLP